MGLQHQAPWGPDPMSASRSATGPGRSGEVRRQVPDEGTARGGEANETDDGGPDFAVIADGYMEIADAVANWCRRAWKAVFSGESSS